jgi:hypothetical protein
MAYGGSECDVLLATYGRRIRDAAKWWMTGSGSLNLDIIDMLIQQFGLPSL